MKTKNLVKFVESIKPETAIKIGQNSTSSLIASAAYSLAIYGFDKAVDDLASIFHENWRKEFIKINGNVPRIKNANDGTGHQININDKFSNLSDFWKEDNRKAAKFTLKIVLIYGGNMSEEKMASLVHGYWKKRNPWSNVHKKDEPFLFSLYRNLPNEEQEKDLIQIRLAEHVLEEIYAFEMNNPSEWYDNQGDDWT